MKFPQICLRRLLPSLSCRQARQQWTKHETTMKCLVDIRERLLATERFSHRSLETTCSNFEVLLPPPSEVVCGLHLSCQRKKNTYRLLVSPLPRLILIPSLKVDCQSASDRLSRQFHTRAGKGSRGCNRIPASNGLRQKSVYPPLFCLITSVKHWQTLTVSNKQELLIADCCTGNGPG